MQCIICQTEFSTLIKHAKYCSTKCKSRAKYLKQIEQHNHICLVCQKPTHNPKFCSRECSAKMNIRTTTKPTFCQGCGKKLSDKWIQRKKCDECKLAKKLSYDRNLTIKELKLKMPNINQFHAKIRGLARNVYKSTGICQKCGYNKHTNICHIKPVNKFNEDTLISEINNINNLTELCPNCHWEFDHIQVA